jgi:hypothetical protein
MARTKKMYWKESKLDNSEYTGMSNHLVVSFNGDSQIEYDRDKPLPIQQEQFLSRMDCELKQGFDLGGERIDNPDLQKRAQFVASNLLEAVVNGEEQKAAAMTAYLAVFLPDLKQVKAVETPEGVLIDLVFDREYSKEVRVQLHPRAQSTDKKH